MKAADRKQLQIMKAAKFNPISRKAKNYLKDSTGRPCFSLATHSAICSL